MLGMSKTLTHKREEREERRKEKKCKASAERITPTANTLGVR